MNMKTYIKPNVEVVVVEMQALMDNNSITSVTGPEDVEYNNKEYSDGYVDSRSFDDWD